jgi:DprA winged helix domain
LLAAAGLNASEKKIYGWLTVDRPRQIDDIVERSGLNSSDVLATLFGLEMKGIVRQLPGKAVQQGLALACNLLKINRVRVGSWLKVNPHGAFLHLLG